MKIAVILGGAENIFEDFFEARKLLGNRAFDIFLVNDLIACFAGEASYGVSMHPRKMRGWLNQRTFRKFPPLKDFWTHVVDHSLGGRTALCWGPPSGLFATKIAMVDLNYAKAILCGIPMQSERGHFLRRKPWMSCDAYKPSWKTIYKMGKLDNVRSMSGWTRDLLGLPDSKWLNDQF